MDFDYKKYSLEHLENWVHDVLSSDDTSPQEIYNTIKKVVEENYYIYKNHTGRCYELLALLNGNGIGHIQLQDGYAIDPHGNQVKVCDKENLSPEYPSPWNNFWGENEHSAECLTNNHSSYYYEYTRNDLNKENPFGTENNESMDNKVIYESPDGGETIYSREFGNLERTLIKEDKVKKWVLPVEVDGPSGEYFLTFPDELLEISDLKESDQVEWIDCGDGSYLLKKVTK